MKPANANALSQDASSQASSAGVCSYTSVTNVASGKRLKRIRASFCLLLLSGCGEPAAPGVLPVNVNSQPQEIPREVSLGVVPFGKAAETFVRLNHKQPADSILEGSCDCLAAEILVDGQGASILHLTVSNKDQPPPQAPQLLKMNLRMRSAPDGGTANVVVVAELHPEPLGSPVL